MRVAKRFVVSGRVQGVGFRYFVQAAAARENVTGWVRNTPDGRVEAVAEAAPDAMERFERSVRVGPGGARVAHVEVEAIEPTGAEHGFVIR
jgi:acylphosphatase